MRFWIILILVGWSALAQARQINGVDLPDTLTIDHNKLVLNGAGIRSKYFLDVYVAGLYLPAKIHNADQIIKADEIQSIRLVITSSLITHRRLYESIEDGVRKSAGKDFSRYKPMLSQLEQVLTFEVKSGDEFDFTFIPGEGTYFYRNGTLLRQLKDEQFKQVLFGIWLGKDPVQSSLKEDLLAENS